MQTNLLRWSTVIGATERALTFVETLRRASTYFDRIRIVNDVLGPNWVFRLVDVVGADVIRANRPSWHEFYVLDRDRLHMPLDPGAPETRDYLGEATV